MGTTDISLCFHSDHNFRKQKLHPSDLSVRLAGIVEKWPMKMSMKNVRDRMSLLLFLLVFNNPPSKPGFLSNSNKALLQTWPRTALDLSSYQLGVFSAPMILRTTGGTKICYQTTRKIFRGTMVKHRWQN